MSLIDQVTAFAQSVGTDIKSLFSIASGGKVQIDSIVGPQIIYTQVKTGDAVASLAFDKPTGLAVGDTVFVSLRNSSFTESVDFGKPTGFERRGFPFVAANSDARMQGWFRYAVTDLDDPILDSLTFSVAASSRWVGCLYVIRDNGDTVDVVGFTPTGTGYPDGIYRASKCFPVAAHGAPALGLYMGASEFTANVLHTPTSLPLGITAVGSGVSNSNTTVTRTYAWFGSERIERGNADEMKIGWAGTTTNPGVNAVVVAPASRNLGVDVRPDPWVRVIDENWTTDVAEGSWSGSTYAAKYATPTEGEMDTSHNGRYRSSIISVSGGRLRVHPQTVAGEHRVAKVIFGPRGLNNTGVSPWAGAQGVKVEVEDFRADTMVGYKALLIGWKADPYTWDVGGEIDFGEVDNLNGASPVKFLVYRVQAGYPSWAGYNDIGTAISGLAGSRLLDDGQGHKVVMEWVPGQYVAMWWDGVLVGYITGNVPTVPMWFGLQVETGPAVVGATPPDDAVTGYVSIGRIQISTMQGSTTSPMVNAMQAVLNVARRAIATKASIGLDQVDNTSDADKPLSEAATAALSSKMPYGAAPVFVYALSPTAWPTQAASLPAGYTGPVWFDGTAFPGMTVAPPWMRDNDHLLRLT